MKQKFYRIVSSTGKLLYEGWMTRADAEQKLDHYRRYYPGASMSEGGSS